MLLRHVLEKQLIDHLKRWISNVATFEKVREKNTGEKNKQIKNYKHNKLVRMVFNMPTVQTH